MYAIAMWDKSMAIVKDCATEQERTREEAHGKKIKGGAQVSERAHKGQTAGRMRNRRVNDERGGRIRQRKARAEGKW